ncbi:response regulator [bacterium]|jgi:response regulator RpfG family c-di-GMP phosphodiesterase|nr:response regulator [bacterium]
MDNNLPWLLIVDDDLNNLHSTKRVLESLKINIHTAISGEDALKAIIQREFFLILMDVQMPEMDGFETTSLIRGNKNYRDIPIIFLTAISKEKSYVEAGYKEGAIDYLFKPVNPLILVSKIKIFLDYYLIKQELSRSNEELNSFASVVAHDLKEPLRKILFYAGQLQNKKGEINAEFSLKKVNSIFETGIKMRDFFN